MPLKSNRALPSGRLPEAADCNAGRDRERSAQAGEMKERTGERPRGGRRFQA